MLSLAPLPPSFLLVLLEQVDGRSRLQFSMASCFASKPRLLGFYPCERIKHPETLMRFVQRSDR